MTLPKNKGFTILELIVTVTVLAVLMAIAVPTFRGTMRRAHLSDSVNTLVGDLQFARSEAAMRHKFVSVCRSLDGKACATDDSNYDVGYIVYAYDASADGANQTYDASDSTHELLRTTPITTDVSIQATDGDVLTFGQTGLPAANGTRTAMEFVFCSRQAGKTKDPGENNSESPGSRVMLGVSGSLINTKLASSASCLPTE
ncbi:GspH/FimT family pseudopilin [Luteibacter yeojuensis]|uniref:Type II secretion system protein H n=1 Tax=Luteibacter yeojuensis TaxID=345309 RepID=A0A7X5TQF7_9GAMM|nr:GspH/FimT family pseudopilin [Luteibacter yeojuensis]NID15467.1 prepilin-type N-terminal cleavage/methylation domain-containing protein [Luteibacter yeojuensis]